MFGNHPMQNKNLHDIESTVDPIYQANSNFVALHMDYELNDNLTLSSISGYNRNIGFSLEDYDRIVATTPFGATPAAGNAIGPAIATAFGIPVALGNAIYAGATPLSAGYPGLFPGGVVNDPQLGPSNLQRVYDEGDEVNDELTQEVRLSSHFKGPLNFTVGGIFVHQVNFSNYYVLFNSATAYLQVQNSLAVAGGAPAPFTIDPSNRPTGFGHNYYDSRYGDELNSYAGFGEVNYKLTDDLKITGGLPLHGRPQEGEPLPHQPGATGQRAGRRRAPDRCGGGADRPLQRGVDAAPRLHQPDAGLRHLFARLQAGRVQHALPERRRLLGLLLRLCGDLRA